MRLPDVILRTFEDRIQKALRASNISDTELFKGLDLSRCDIKERSEIVLNRVYDVRGFTAFMEVVDNLRSFSERDKEDVIIAKGEIAEVVCEVMTKHFIKTKGLKDWHIHRGLILGDKKNPKFSTELDLILVTPACVSVIEIKSYNGTKTLTGDCNVKTKYVDKNVFSQNVLHIKSFWSNFKACAKQPQGAIKSVLFSFSKGDIVDKRESSAKALMPVFSETDYMGYLLALSKVQRNTWNVNKLEHAIAEQKKTARSLEEHIKYLKETHK